MSIRSNRSEAEQLQILADAGISAEDVDLVVQDRLRRRRQQAREDSEVLQEATNALARRVVLDAPVPEAERWGKGALVTPPDEIGALRMLAAAITQAELIANGVDTSEDVAQTRGEVLRGMCRREAEGDHDENLRLIDGARPRSGGLGGGW